MIKQSIELVSGRTAAPPAPENLQDLLGVEECVRYYPPDLSAVIDPDSVFRPRPTMSARREIDLFVDVPFCRTICGFCPFNVYQYDARKVHDYLRALTKEIREITAPPRLRRRTRPHGLDRRGNPDGAGGECSGLAVGAVDRELRLSRG